MHQINSQQCSTDLLPRTPLAQHILLTRVPFSRRHTIRVTLRLQKHLQSATQHLFLTFDLDNE